MNGDMPTGSSVCGITQKSSMVYICGSANSEIKEKLLSYLSKHHISVRLNDDNIDLYVEECYHITQSILFVFVMDNLTLSSKYCLTLLGICIAFDVPILAIRSLGYTLPPSLPRHFSVTEIVSRKTRSLQLEKKENLPAVATLEKAVRALLSTSLAYHRDVLQSCCTEIQKIVSNKEARTKRRFDNLCEEYRKNIISKTISDKRPSISRLDTPISNKSNKDCSNVGVKQSGNSSEYAKPKVRLVKYRSSPVLNVTSEKATEPVRRASSLPPIPHYYLVASSSRDIQMVHYPMSPTPTEKEHNYKLETEVSEDDDYEMSIGIQREPSYFFDRDDDDSDMY